MYFYNTANFVGKKIVFFDIDGTVWDWNRNIPKSTIEAIGKLRQNGHLAFICSGRAKSHIIDPHLFAIGFDGVIAACGSYIELGGETIYNNLIPNDVVKLTVETILQCNLPSVLEGPRKNWLSETGFETDDFVIAMRKEMGPNAVPFNSYTEDIRINKFSSDVLRKSDYARVKETLSQYYYFIEHGLTADFKGLPGEEPEAVVAVIEAVPHGITKGTGIVRTLEYLGIDVANSYGIGDSANDIDMFNAVGHSICMGDGAEVAKSSVDYVTTGLWDDGIQNALKHFGLI